VRAARSPVVVVGLLVAATVGLLLVAYLAARTEPGELSLERGREVFEGRGRCATCHAREGDGAGYRGPVLDAGLRDRPAERGAGLDVVDYVVLSLYRPTAHTVDGFPMGLMPAANLAPLSLDDDDVASVVLFLLSDGTESGGAQLRAAIRAAQRRHGDVVLRPAPTAGDPERGRALFRSLGCPSCHALGGVTDPERARAPGPELTGIGGFQSPAYIAQSIWQPQAAVTSDSPEWRGTDGTSTRMPSYRDVIVPADVDDLVAFLVSTGC